MPAHLHPAPTQQQKYMYSSARCSLMLLAAKGPRLSVSVRHAPCRHVTYPESVRDGDAPTTPLNPTAHVGKANMN